MMKKVATNTAAIINPYANTLINVMIPINESEIPEVFILLKIK